MLGAATTACPALPEVKYETDRLEIAPDFEHPICEGTLNGLDDHVELVEDGLGRLPNRDPIRLYWLTGDIDRICSTSPTGCFFPGTRVIFADGQTITHEIVHAVLDTADANVFVEEGMAELFSGVAAYHRPDQTELLAGDMLRSGRGGLDYAAAAHFVHYLYEAGGGSFPWLVDTLDSAASAGEIEAVLETTFDSNFGTLETGYRERAPYYYAGLTDQIVEEVLWEDLEDELVVELACDREDTFGPLWDSSEGMYRVMRVRAEAPLEVRFAVHGSWGSWVRVIDPYSSLEAGFVTQWPQPNPEVDPLGPKISAGVQLNVELRGYRSHLLVFATESTEPTSIALSATLIDPPTPPGLPEAP